jgi:predicted membrane metal-binding protein
VAMRRAGISHFVAVSGANVAGFLMLWWLLLGPIGVGPRWRGWVGLPFL